MERYKEIERSIIKKYRKEIWSKFIKAIKDYELIKEKVTEEKLKDYFKDIVHGKITRYEMPTISALNFVMEDALGGGVTRSLAVDMHGKTLGSALLEMEID